MPATAGAPEDEDGIGRQVFGGRLRELPSLGWKRRAIAHAALTGIRAVNEPDAVNLTQVVLHGTRLHSDLGEQFMPAFGKAYSDAEIAAMVNYVTGRFGARAATITPVQVARHREQE